MHFGRVDGWDGIDVGAAALDARQVVWKAAEL